MNCRDDQKRESSVLLLNASFIAFEILNSANISASSALGSISVLNGSLYHETCNVLLKYDRNLAETISICTMMQVLILSVKSILFIFTVCSLLNVQRWPLG